ncbi:MAG: hypothetical protein JXB17_05960 [Bacteroidales bacterium]|nr:hypothetical protein [Bacteroidales bacterium]
MKQIHVECKPDELLVLKLGFQRKMVTHHQGKSRIFHALKKAKNHLAIVDEDPRSVPIPYENSLAFVKEFEGIKCYTDKSNNKIFVLKVKLEDWIINACKQQKIGLSRFGLPEKPDDLNDVINNRLRNFERLIDELIKKNNPAIMKLKLSIISDKNKKSKCV